MTKKFLWRMFMLKKILYIFLAYVILSIFIISCGSNVEGPKEIAEKALNAMIWADGEAFISLVSPDRKARSDQGSGLAIGPAEVEIVKECEGVNVEYLERASNEIEEGREVTLLFESPCLKFGMMPMQDSFTLLFEKVNDRWFLAGIRE
jgi:hypothetical protein